MRVFSAHKIHFDSKRPGFYYSGPLQALISEIITGKKGSFKYKLICFICIEFIQYKNDKIKKLAPFP